MLGGSEGALDIVVADRIREDVGQDRVIGGCRILLPMVAWLALAGCTAGPGPGAVEIDSVVRQEVRGTAARGRPRSPEAVPVALPDHWGASRRTGTSTALYRAELRIGEPPSEPWAIYLPRFSMNVAVAVNGVPVGDGGPFAPRMAWAWTRPLLLPLPGDLLRAGTNLVEIRLGVLPTFPALLAPFYVGPERALRSAFETRLFWQIAAVWVCVVLAGYMGILGLALRARRPEMVGTGWSSIACIAWAVGMLHLVVLEPPLPARLWQWLSPAALAAAVSCLAVAAERYSGLRSVRFERIVLAVWIAGAIAFGIALALDAPALVDGVIVAWVLGTALVAGAFLRRLFAIRLSERSPTLRWAAPLGILALVAGTHDVALGLAIEIPPPFALLPFLGAAVALWGGWRLIERLCTALDASTASNLDLERRVQERGEEIARGYERIRHLEREQAAQAERERLMRDVHDGLGGQLTSTLALAENEEISRDEVADALRDALDDMRVLVNSLAPADPDLVGVLAGWRARIEPRIERHGLRFEWEVTDLPSIPWLGPGESLSVLRILQEAVANVINHAHARTIRVRTGPGSAEQGRPGVFVQITDDGNGGAAMRPGGHGLANMSRRAAELGGAVRIAGGASGTRVVLWLPLDRRASPPPERGEA